jgi:hypothetical protein
MAECSAGRREVLHSTRILVEFGERKKLVTMIKICLNETCIRILIGKHFSCNLPTKVAQNKEMLYPHCFSTLP